jgi:hypothetical protein
MCLKQLKHLILLDLDGRHKLITELRRAADFAAIVFVVTLAHRNSLVFYGRAQALLGRKLTTPVPGQANPLFCTFFTHTVTGVDHPI